jgi:G patch domain-containing protein 1
LLSLSLSRGTRFVLSRDELLTLPEFVLLSLFPNGLFPEGHMGGGFADGDAVQVDVRSTMVTLAPHPATRKHKRSAMYSPILTLHITDPTCCPQYDPASLQYMLDFFRTVAQTIPSDTSATTSQDGDVVPIEPMGNIVGRDDSSKRAGIIVLREDLDFYAIPPRVDIAQPEMIEVKRAAAKALLRQSGIFSGLKRSDEPGTTEAHLIEMLTAG